MSEEWGDWVLHDGSGFPAPVGTVVHRVFADGTEWVAPIGASRWAPFSGYRGRLYACSWDWSSGGLCCPVLRYRLRRPPALRLLVNLAETLPEPVREGVEA